MSPRDRGESDSRLRHLAPDSVAEAPDHDLCMDAASWLHVEEALGPDVRVIAVKVREVADDNGKRMRRDDDQRVPLDAA